MSNDQDLRTLYYDWPVPVVGNRISYDGPRIRTTLESIDLSIYTLNGVLDTKVDKVPGKGLSDQNYTQAEKDKLAGLESSKFRGQYVSLEALITANPTPEVGSYANIDTGVGGDVERAIWDSTDGKWVIQAMSASDMTPAEVKALYEENADTNSFTDAEKNKLRDIQAGAQVNAVTSVAGKGGAVTLTKSDVGLGAVDNTSDANKPVSTPQQTALNAKANLASPGFTGTPTAPTQAAATNNTSLANTAHVKAAIAHAKQTGPTDTTAGKLLIVGAGGILRFLDIRSQAAATGTPADVFGGGTIFGFCSAGVLGITALDVNAYGELKVTNQWSDVSGIGCAHREFTSNGRKFLQHAQSATVWGPWVELYHTSNQLGLGTTPESARNALKWHLGSDVQQTVSSASGSLHLNLDLYSVFDLVLTGATTLNAGLSYLPANGVRSVVVRVRQGAVAQTLTWWGGITWLAPATPPAPGANKVAEYVLSYSATGWIGRVGAMN